MRKRGFGMPRRTWASFAVPVCLVVALAGCGREEAPSEREAARVARETPPTALPARPAPAGSPNGRPDVVRKLIEEHASPRHAADGVGRAWLEANPEGGGLAAVAGTSDRFVIVFEAGPHGVAPGGAILFQVALGWGWRRTQVG